MLRTSTTTLARAMAALRIAPAVVRPTAARVLAVTPRFYQTTPAVHAAATGAGSEEVPEPPKRPPNSFALFTADMSAKRPADVRPRDWFKQLKPMWDALSESERGEYRDQYAKLKLAHEVAVAEYEAQFTPEQRAERERKVAEAAVVKTVKKERAAAKKAGPKRPLNAFQMFMMDQRPNMPADIQRDMTKVATEASRLWKELPESGKKEYQARNREAMRKYMLEVAMGEGQGGAASE
ncbi:hypothetical protein AMAG_08409 [Allomyces macrogynus ATCC 38327]|uniref:HMG box domain-containing protein n=1 Tax=Allomyces macrogynus (strain ATCC 38327) TaxID=578462 RepID=A0A0L0SLL1_ALLM3|nr:hypothetical protein AMAG_08409 [Allomyces macrogynus ATCC 38327]|eukprot:KNE63265.1 hypothetical protein AMAG_08409 [Allomyces macrogynus ATCC 38327]